MKVFISYNHKDEEWKNLLVTHLGVLGKQGFLDIWNDRKIPAGEDWLPTIEKAINEANVAIILISANFLNSNFILNKEIPALLQRRAKENMELIPLIVRPCAWTEIDWLSKIQARPKDGKALSTFSEGEIDEHLAEFSIEINSIFKSIKNKTQHSESSTKEYHEDAVEESISQEKSEKTKRLPCREILPFSGRIFSSSIIQCGNNDKLFKLHGGHRYFFSHFGKIIFVALAGFLYYSMQLQSF